MARRLFELCGKDRNVRFSPFVWRVRLALCHKDLEFQGVPGNYHEKDQFGPSGSSTYPVLKDGDKWVPDSWAIAEYLEKAYPGKPSLFGSPEGQAHSRFMHFYFTTLIHPPIFLMIAPDIHAGLDEGDKDYFYKTRSERVGMPLEDLISLRDKNMGKLKTGLSPLRERLKETKFLSGDKPLYPDYIGFSAFKWAALCSPLDLLEGEETIRDWFERIEALYLEKETRLEKKPLL